MTEMENRQRPWFDFRHFPAAIDSLEYGPSARTVARLISNSELPLVMGLFGSWGAGKSSFLGFLRDALQERTNQGRGFLPVVFEPWKLESTDSILYDLVSALCVQATDENAVSSTEEAENLFDHLNNLEFSSYRDLLVSGISGFAESQAGIGAQVREMVSRVVRTKPYELAERRIRAAGELPKAYSEYVHCLNKIPVVLIDDLDRCRPKTVVRLFEALKQFLQSPDSDIVYVLAMDHEKIIEAVSQHYGYDGWEDGWEYLSKICNVMWYIPRPQIRGLLEELARRLRHDGDRLDVFWSCLLHEGTARLFYACDMYLPRRLIRVVTQTHMVLSMHCLDLISVVERTLGSLDAELPVPQDSAEAACYRFLLAVFVLRERYPEMYARVAYKTHEQRADLLLDMGRVVSSYEDLDQRQESISEVATRWGLSELHEYLHDHVMLDVIGRLFSPDEIVTGCPEEDRVSYEQLLRKGLLNPIMDELMSS